MLYVPQVYNISKIIHLIKAFDNVMLRVVQYMYYRITSTKYIEIQNIFQNWVWVGSEPICIHNKSTQRVM